MVCLGETEKMGNDVLLHNKKKNEAYLLHTEALASMSPCDSMTQLKDPLIINLIMMFGY